MDKSYIYCKFASDMNLRFKILLITFILCIFASGCIVVKHKEAEDVAPTIQLSPKPELAMSEEPLLSKDLDMMAFLPEHWFFVDVENEANTNVFAVAVNPQYTMSAVFSTIPPSSRVNEIIEREGLLGLARYSFELHQLKIPDIKLIGKYGIVNMGNYSFAKYEYTTSGSSVNARSIVFKSELGKFYEFTLIPMTFTGRPMPTTEEINKTFFSILATIQY